MENNTQSIETVKPEWTAPVVEALDIFSRTEAGIGSEDDGMEMNTNPIS